VETIDRLAGRRGEIPADSGTRNPRPGLNSLKKPAVWLRARYAAQQAGDLEGIMAADNQGDVARGQVMSVRAQLVVQFACELLGLGQAPATDSLRLDMSVEDFTAAFERRYGPHYPKLVFRGDATLERARLHRRDNPKLPRVVLRKGRPFGSKTRHGKQAAFHNDSTSLTSATGVP
jgi:hypothetical protein